MNPEPYQAAILLVVNRIPRGRVASYGQVAELAGLPGRARLVGRVLSHLPDNSNIPWQRVVNARGEISFTEGSDAHRRQRQLLEQEGVLFSGRRIMRQCRWRL
jgi:methylated-DNA-protein-cysteine methyltransferase-like protein